MHHGSMLKIMRNNCRRLPLQNQGKLVQSISHVCQRSLSTTMQPSTSATWSESLFTFLSQNPVTNFIQTSIEYTHDTLGVPWGGAVVLAAVATRVVTFPLFVFAERLRGQRWEVEMAVAARTRDRLADVYGIHNAKAVGGKEFQKAFRESISRATLGERVTLGRIMLVSLSPLPVWISSMFAVRNLSGGFLLRAMEPQRPDIANEGFLWMENLLLPDPSYVLVSTMCVSMLANIWLLNPRLPLPTISRFNNTVRMLAWSGVAFYIAKFSLTISACVPLFWLTTSLLTLTVHMLVRIRPIRVALRIPGPPPATLLGQIRLGSILRPKKQQSQQPVVYDVRWATGAQRKDKDRQRPQVQQRQSDVRGQNQS